MAVAALSAAGWFTPALSLWTVGELNAGEQPTSVQQQPKTAGVRLRKPQIGVRSPALTWSQDGVLRPAPHSIPREQSSGPVAPAIRPFISALPVSGSSRAETHQPNTFQSATSGTGVQPPPVPVVPFPQNDSVFDTDPEFDQLPPEHVRAPQAVLPEFDQIPDGPEPRNTDSQQPAPMLSETRMPGGHSGFGPAPGTSGFRATVESDAPQWLGSYMGRTDQQTAGGEPFVTDGTSVQIPLDYQAWWDSMVRNQVGIAPKAFPVEVSVLVQRALECSPQVLALQAEPEVQQRVVWQEEAVFDWRAFLDSTYDDTNDPIGNTLTTGNNSDRFMDNRFSASGGVRKRTTTGGEVSVAQRIGYQDNNSIFLQPNPQSTSRLELSFRQPLLGKAGTFYSQNQVLLARITTNTSGDEVLTELQTHLYKVTEAYWQLYRARAEFFQRQKLLNSARTTLQTLEGRNEVDTIPRQILRARAAVARAESRMQRAITSIRNAESQIRLLVNDPEMLNNGPLELTPVETPIAALTPVTLRDSLQTALINRPDISKAIRQMRASSVRLGVSRNELLPKLDFIVKTYVAGLENRSEIPEAVGNQFSQGGPGYTVGLEFEVPLGNRAAKARMEQRQWELQRSMNVFRATVETSLTEVEVANREVETSWREMSGRFHAMVAAQNETDYLQDRFTVLPMAEDSAVLLLEDLLDGFERLSDEESAFVEAQVNYALSIIQLRRATGVLLRSRHDHPEILPAESQWMSQRATDAGSSDQSEPSFDMDDSESRPEFPSAAIEEEAAAESTRAVSFSRILPKMRSRKSSDEKVSSEGGHSLIQRQK
jgi:outer membrane protein TolC